MLVVLGGLVFVALVFFASGYGPHCRGAGRGNTPDAALDAYYRGCFSKPRRSAPTAGEEHSTRYANWASVVEYEVKYGDRTRFVWVGKERPASEWRVLDGEGSGP